MYLRLIQLVNQFITLNVLVGASVFEHTGYLLVVHPEYFILAEYDTKTGLKTCDYSAPTFNVVSILAGHRDDNELALKISMAAGNIQP